MQTNSSVKWCKKLAVGQLESAVSEWPVTRAEYTIDLMDHGFKSCTATAAQEVV